MMPLTRIVACTVSAHSFFSFPTWYEYLPNNTIDQYGTCAPVINNINDVWLIVLGVTNILLHLAAIVAIVFVLYGGVQYILSQGNPDSTKHAQTTVLNALIGLVISVGAATFVGFIAGQFH